MSTRDKVKIIPLNSPDRLAVKAPNTLCKICRYFSCDCGEEIQATVVIEQYLVVKKCSGFLMETQKN